MKRTLKKIALINPKRHLFKQNIKASELFESNVYLRPWFTPPLSLFVIASHTPSDIDVVIIDETFEEIDFEANYDLVGLTAMTNQANRAYVIADQFRAKGVPVVMGGIHASILPDEALQHVDSVFKGESETTWGAFLNDFRNSSTKPIYQADKAFDLTESRIPRYDLLNNKQFKQSDAYFKFVPVQATRGCPHDCSFCVVSKFYGKTIRKKTIQMVVDEIKELQRYNMDHTILFTDDNMFVDRKYAKELLRALIPLKIKFIAQTDVKVADDPELLELAYQSGCLTVFIGFESPSAESLSEINSNYWKMKQVDNYADAIAAIQKHGIFVFGSFVVGFNHDNIETFDTVKNFVLENNILAHFTLLTPFPGSKIYDQYRDEGRLLEGIFWDNCNFFDLTYKHDNLTKDGAESSIIKLYTDVLTDENVMKRTMHMMKLYKKLPPRWSLS